MFKGKGREIGPSLVSLTDTLDIGSRVILKLADTLPIGVSVFVDRYFTSEKLIDAMLARKIYVSGTLMQNRISKIIQTEFKSNKELKDSGRRKNSNNTFSDAKNIN